jgi:hypothetical protein
LKVKVASVSVKEAALNEIVSRLMLVGIKRDSKSFELEAFTFNDDRKSIKRIPKSIKLQPERFNVEVPRYSVRVLRY